MAAAEFDYIVVGAGSSGAALAARLGEVADKTTCVIEAGGQDTHPFIHIPSFVAAAIGREATNWRFKTVPQPGMAGREVPVPRGKVLGGSGSINGMVYFRGHPPKPNLPPAGVNFLPHPVLAPCQPPPPLAQ